MIAPLWTDLYPVASSTFRTEGTTTYQRYFWNNIAEISNPSNLNTFSLEIRPTGFIGATYNQINIQNQNVTAGITGDIALGQMQQFYYGRGILPGALSNWSVNNTPGDQCVINPLSSPTCPGYTEAMCATNPLYSTSCSGYQQAYFTQQCTANPLYNVNCPGYASAYLTYQCSINPLYSTTCEGYETAYFNQQCSLNSLYSVNCPGYQQAYFNQQCSLDGLYSTQCPNYAEAYGKKMALENNKPKPPAPSENETKVALVSDSTVNQVITTTATSANPAQAATSTVPLVQPPQRQTEIKIGAVVTQEQKREERKDVAAGNNSNNSSSGSKDQPKTGRQELQAKREAAAKAKAVEEGKNLAENMGKAADMEQQKMVQNVVLQAMAHVPGFDAYTNARLTDKPFYRPEQIYKGQVNVDNRNLGRRMFGPSDQLHNEMVDSQYQLGK
jgi:hypothetical protein